MGVPKDKSKQTTALKADEVKSIDGKFAAETSQRKEFGRSSWMALLVPAVGTFAVFSSLMLNIVRTYQKHGFPEDSLRRRDVVIIAIPALLIGYATLEAIEIMDTKSAETEIMGE
jgi:hypothetical protein